MERIKFILVEVKKIKENLMEFKCMKVCYIENVVYESFIFMDSIVKRKGFNDRIMD